MSDFYKELQNPPKKYRPVPFWSWNEKLDVNDTKEQIKEMDNAGIGGFFMHARGGLQTEYLSEEWFDNILAALDEGEKRQMLAWGYDENGWPSGFGSGAVNGLGIEYQQKYLRCKITDAPVNEEYTVTNVTVGGKNYHCYYEVNPFYVDTLNKKVIKEFLKSTHEKYRDTLKSDFKQMKGFFTDEPQVSRNGVPWSFILEDKYKKAYGEQLKEQLPKLFYDLDGYEQIRYNFWKLVRDLFTDSFMATIFEWCRKNGSELTGHMVLEEGYYEHILSNGCCMPSYEYMDIPGMDHLCRIMPSVQTEMQLTSVCNQLGKKQILSETFAGCGWNVSFADLRKIYEHQMVHGVNLLCQHLQGYSLRGIRKRDYPASLFRQQPWWQDYKVFNDTVSRIGMLIAEGDVSFNILVLHTVESGWLKSNDRQKADEYCIEMKNVMTALENAQLQYHLGESRIIERHGSIKNGKFVIGTQSYSAVIVPPAICLNKNTFDMLCNFKEQGGLLIFAGEIPEFIDGKKTDKVLKLADGCIKTDIKNIDSYIPNSCRSIDIELDDDSQKPNIRSTVRIFKDMGMTMYYICNFGESDSQLKISVKGKSACLFDPECGMRKPVIFSNANDCITVNLKVYSNKSIILFVYDENVCEAEDSICFDKNETNISSKLKGQWNVVKADENSLTLDYCDLFVNGEKIAENLPISDAQEKLCSYGKPVKAKAIFNFNIKSLEFEKCSLMLETPEIFDIIVNGIEVKKNNLGYCHDKCFKTVNIFDCLKQGENEICLVFDFAQSPEVYKGLKDALRFEAFKNKFTYDMELEAVYLKGDFGVYNKNSFDDIENNALKTVGDFYLDKAPKTVFDGSLEKQGYPFFAGSITLCKNTVLSQEEISDAVMEFAKLPSIVTAVEINGKNAGKILWKPYKIDIADYLKTGENEIKITLTGSLRNLLGPFHLTDGEALFIHPSYFFHETHLWGDGVNQRWTDTYCFVQNGLFFK